MRVKNIEKHGFKVMITGFKDNPSGDIAKLMPNILAADHPLNVAGVDINLMEDSRQMLPEFSWASIRQGIKDLHDAHNKEVDLWIHMGRSPWSHVTCERRAYRQDFNSSWLAELGSKGYYRKADNCGRSADDIGPCPWMEVPIGLETAIDVNRVVVDSNKKLYEYAKAQPTRVVLEVRSHAEPGSLGCGYTHYESMANCYIRGKPLNVLFCHVPPHEDPVAWAKARDAILTIIGASYLSIHKSLNRDPDLPEEWRDRFEAAP